MTAPTDDQTLGLSRRHLLAGAGAAWAATVLPATAGAQAPAAVSQALVPQALLPQALAPAITGLQYHQIDGIAFTTLGNEGVSGPPGNYVFWQNITGAQPISPNTYINAPLDLPVGAVIRQVNALYQGQPIVAIRKRSFATGAVTDPLTPTSMTASPGGPFASSLNVANVPIEAGASYQLRFFCAAGVSIMGATLGFVPPPSAFVPFTGPKPRALDTRSGAPIGAGEVRTLDLTAYGAVGRAAVINVTATGGNTALLQLQ